MPSLNQCWLVSTEPLGTYFSEIWIKIKQFWACLPHKISHVVQDSMCCYLQWIFIPMKTLIDKHLSSLMTALFVRQDQGYHLYLRIPFQSTYLQDPATQMNLLQQNGWVVRVCTSWILDINFCSWWRIYARGDWLIIWLSSAYFSTCFHRDKGMGK